MTSLPTLAHLATAGMTTRDTLSLDRDLRRFRYARPAVVAAADGGFWWTSHTIDEWRAGEVSLEEPPGDLLDRFVALARYSDSADAVDDVAALAEEAGPLFLCDHELPRGHIATTGQHPDAGGTAKHCVTYKGSVGARRFESASSWVSLAKQFRSALILASQLHADELGPEARWRDLKHYTWESTATGWDLRSEAVTPAAENLRSHLPPLVYGRMTVDGVVSDWCRWDSATLALDWHWQSSEPPTVSVSTFGIFGDLVAQLMFALAKRDGMVGCTGCGGPYTPKRKPRVGQRNYCPQCRAEGIPQRHAARDYKQRQRAGGST